MPKFECDIYNLISTPLRLCARLKLFNQGLYRSERFSMKWRNTQLY